MPKDFVSAICIQRDSAGLNSQNNELKFRLQAMEQQAQLRDGKNFSMFYFIHCTCTASKNTVDIDFV